MFGLGVGVWSAPQHGVLYRGLRFLLIKKL